MNELIIQEHNKLIKPEDDWFHLGDFSFGTTEITVDALLRMNGRKRFIRGNHDKKLDTQVCRSMLHSYKDYDFVKLAGRKIALMHYPIESWQEKHHGSLHLHGHTHGNTSNGEAAPTKNRMDVGIDNRKDNLMAPFNIEEVFATIKDQNDKLYAEPK